MGKIEDKHRKRRDTDKHPLSGSLGKTEETNDFDIDSETIKDQQNKK
ncbi:MAG TPA: hypothetical protein VFM60_00030 [Salinimicrobium sp.]|nr:hypothetical protein [Salinimicrobium sp.]